MSSRWPGLNRRPTVYEIGSVKSILVNSLDLSTISKRLMQILTHPRISSHMSRIGLPSDFSTPRPAGFDAQPREAAAGAPGPPLVTGRVTSKKRYMARADQAAGRARG